MVRAGLALATVTVNLVYKFDCRDWEEVCGSCCKDLLHKLLSSILLLYIKCGALNVSDCLYITPPFTNYVKKKHGNLAPD